jgi:hypothetical protein
MSQVLDMADRLDQHALSRSESTSAGNNHLQISVAHIVVVAEIYTLDDTTYERCDLVFLLSHKSDMEKKKKTVRTRVRRCLLGTEGVYLVRQV